MQKRKTIIGKAFTNLSRRFDKVDGQWFYPVSGVMTKEQNLVNDFTQLPELNAVINWKARAFANMELKVVSKSTNKEVVNDISKLLQNPNWFQAKGEFLRQTKIFHDLFGNEYLYALRPAGMSSLKGLFTLPPQNVEIEVTTKEPFWTLTEDPLQYGITWAGKTEALRRDSVVHLNDNRVSTEKGNYFKGTSKAEALKPALDNIRAAYNARGTNLRNLGALGIISSAARDGMGSIPLQPDDKKELQDDLKQNYGALSHQFKYILSSKAVDFTKLSTDLDKLKAFEEILADFDKVLDAYGLTKDIFSSANNSTFTNKKEAEKQAYQNTIIPESVEWIDALNKLMWLTDKSYHVVGSFTHLPLFQEDQKERADVLFKLTNALSKAFADGAITIEEYKLELAKFYATGKA